MKLLNMVDVLNTKSRNFYLLLGLLVILLYLFPYYYLGEDSYITIHDYLDLTIGHINNIVNNEMFFSMDGKLPIMDGVERGGIPFTSPLELKSICFFLFPGYWAIVLNILIVKVFAFIGMFFLLDTYVTKKRILSFVVSVMFFIIPFYIDYSLSAAGIPLLLYAIVNFIKWNRIILSYAIVFLYAFNSSLALSGLFVCSLLLLYIVILYIKKKQVNKHLVCSLLILCFLYLVSNWSILSGFFISNEFISNRVEMVTSYSIPEIWGMICSNLTNSHYHCGNFSVIPIILSVISVLILCRDSFNQLFPFLWMFFIVVAMIIVGTTVKLIPIQFFSSFNFERFYFVYSTICFVLFTKSCDLLLSNKRLIFTMVLIAINTISVLNYNTDYFTNLRLMANKQISQPTFKQFYDTVLFQKIAQDINVDNNYTTKVVSIGMFPSIAEYNGFWCLDGYLTSYSLDYKHRFREIMKDELQKDADLKKYFDEWGNRCYLFSSELGKFFLFSKNSDTIISSLDINIDRLRDLGCQFIISAVDIHNYQELGLCMVGDYTTPESFWRVKVYKLN